MLRIATEFPKTERDPISTSGPSIQYVTEPGDSCGQINPFFLSRRGLSNAVEPDYDGHCRRVNGFRFRDPRFAHVVPRQKVVHVPADVGRANNLLWIDMRRVPER